MYANICNTRIPFTLPEPDNGKITLKNWIDGGSSPAETELSLHEPDGKILSLLSSQWTGTGWKCSPVRFQYGEAVYTAWANIQPDRFGVAGRYGYTVCVKYLYTRKPAVAGV